MIILQLILYIICKYHDKVMYFLLLVQVMDAGFIKDIINKSVCKRYYYKINTINKKKNYFRAIWLTETTQ